MKNRLSLLAAALVLFPLIAHGQRGLKVATVSMERLFNEYHQTEKIQRETNIERARIQRENNNRLADIREIDARLSQIRDLLKDKELPEKQRADLREESRNLSQDGRSKENERTEFLKRRNTALSAKVSKQMRGVLKKIQNTVSEAAKKGNYDFIFDSSGNSSLGIPFVLHARDTTDLTDLLLKEINQDAE